MNVNNGNNTSGFNLLAIFIITPAIPVCAGWPMAFAPNIRVIRPVIIIE